MSGIRALHIATLPLTVVRFSAGFLERLAASGYEVQVLVGSNHEIDRLVSMPSIEEVHHVSMTRSIDPLRDAVGLVKIVRLLRRGQYDLIHASTPKAGFLGVVAAWIARVPVRIFTYRGIRLESEQGWRRRLLWLVDWTTIRAATHVVAVGFGMRDRMRELGLVGSKDVVVLASGSSNGVDSSHFRRSSSPGDAPLRKRLMIAGDKTVIGFVGRLTRDKGIVELADAWRSIRDESLALLIIGSEIEGDESVPAGVVEELRIDPLVHFVGFADDPKPYYEAMDLLVLPSYREGVSNVLLEAAAMETAVVASDIYGCRDVVVDGQTGLLVDPQDAKAMAEGITLLASDPTRRRRMGQAARVRAVEQFAQEPIWDGLLALYSNAQSSQSRSGTS